MPSAHVYRQVASRLRILVPHCVERVISVIAGGLPNDVRPGRGLRANVYAVNARSYRQPAEVGELSSSAHLLLRTTPAGTPPRGGFGPEWTALYLLMAVAAWV